jgi:hypothetical protein
MSVLAESDIRPSFGHLLAHLTSADTSRMRFGAAAVLFLLTACTAHGARQAEVLSTPFPGTVLAAHATGGKCSNGGACPFVYRVRITNPTDKDANVQGCTLATPSINLPIMGIGGLGISAHSAKTVTARFDLKIPKRAAPELVGQGISCTGLDWHGNPPI